MFVAVKTFYRTPIFVSEPGAYPSEAPGLVLPLRHAPNHVPPKLPKEEVCGSDPHTSLFHLLNAA